MYSVLVVENEPWIRSAIVKMVDQIGGDFEVAGEAENGEQAWELIHEVWPVLLITDIMMPDMDGLSLIKKVKEHHIPMIFIIISGYDNFKYAQQAISYEVSEYLLKPVKMEELHGAMIRSMDKLSMFKEVNNFISRIQKFLELMYEPDAHLILRKQHSLVEDILRLKHSNPGAFRNLLQILDGKIRALFNEMNITFAETWDIDNIKVDKIHDYFRNAIQTWITHFQANKAQFPKLVIREICEYVDTHYNEEITLQGLAAQAKFSPSHFGSMFKKIMGIPPLQYLNKVRIEKSKQLLIHTDQKIYEIASQVGYANLPYFTRIFKQTTGFSPNEFRKRMGI